MIVVWTGPCVLELARVHGVSVPKKYATFLVWPLTRCTPICSAIRRFRLVDVSYSERY